jgi:ribosome-associated toxin RatA of RatAB toxin-antitoxin module
MSDAVRERIVVNADTDTVLGVIIDYEAYPEWQDETRRVEVLERDDAGRGTRVRFEVDAKVLTAGYVLSYRYGDRQVAWTLEESDQIRTLDGTYRLSPQGAGATEVDYELEIVPSVPMPGMLRRRAAKRIVDSALTGLKRRAESAG